MHQRQRLRRLQAKELRSAGAQHHHQPVLQPGVGCARPRPLAQPHWPLLNSQVPG
nr:hypothetical protein HKBLJLKJ_00012 [Porcine reproductive and respiratory syndrome virus]UNP34471.1 hypothetical protein HKBLJLKJ_00024 [Porcine reproductive and respiratory syndrome virus]UNP34483.1 hypothetical protein HKBLJLKJ_00036 [Porcine reproductive and respiratory syndrome virus]UNP34495.1 hypothetical protein HKBLJLKJ_00048 [Porcine reproductive and respiratory syndrome virus]UNP34508.1 hypothetical protein HKBLJLKJ_00061 [Porcine reproductive and respiratory syndrome virus]